MSEAEYILKIILRARDEFAAVFAKAREQIRGMRGEMSQLNATMDTLNRRVTSLGTRFGNFQKKVDDARLAMAELAKGTSAEFEKLEDAIERQTKAITKSSRAARAAAREEQNIYEQSERLIKSMDDLDKRYRNGSRTRENYIESMRRLASEAKSLRNQMEVGTDEFDLFDELRVRAQDSADELIRIERDRLAQQDQLRKEAARSAKEAADARAAAAQAEREAELTSEREAQAQREADAAAARRKVEENEAAQAKAREARRKATEKEREAESKKQAATEATQNAQQDLLIAFEDYNREIGSSTKLTDDQIATLKRYKTQLNSVANTHQTGSEDFLRYSRASRDADARLVAHTQHLRDSQKVVTDYDGEYSRLEDTVRRLGDEFHRGQRSRADFIDGLRAAAGEARKFRNQFEVGTDEWDLFNMLGRGAERVAQGVIDADRKAAQERERIAKELRNNRIAAEREAAKATADAAKATAAAETASASERERARQRAIDANERAAQAQARATAAAVAEEHNRQEALARTINELNVLNRLTTNNGRLTGTQMQQFRRLRQELATAQRAYRTTSDEFRAIAHHINSVDNVLGRHQDSLRQTTHGHRDLDNTMRRSSGMLSRFSSVLDNMAAGLLNNSDNVARLDNNLRGMIVLAVIVFAQQLLTVLISLGGMFVAVASSAGMAASALAGFGAAAAAQAGPTIGLLIASLARLKDVMDAVSQADTLRQQQFQQAAKADEDAANRADQIASAQDSLVSANQAVEDAQRRVMEATKDLAEARREGVRELEDLILAERRAELAARGAVLSQAEAQEALRQAVASGATGTELQRAEQAVAEADVGVRDTRVDRKRAQEDRRKVGGNIENLESVKNAREGLDDAQRALDNAERAANRASRGLDRARRNAAAAGGETLAAASALAYMRSQLSPAENALYDAIQKFRARYREEVRPITDIIINAYVRGINTATRLLRNRDLLDATRDLATGMARQMDRIRVAFTSDQAIRQFIRIIAQAKKNLEPLGTIAIRLGRAFLNIAEGANPAFSKFLKFVGDLALRFLRLTSDKDKLEDFFLTGERHLEAWIKLGIAIIRLFAALSGAGGADEGLSGVEDATAKINAWTESIQKNGDKVRKFFRDARDVTNELLGVLGDLAKESFRSFNPENVKGVARFLRASVIPAFGEAIRAVGQLVHIVTDLLAIPGVAEVAKWTIALLLFSKVVTGVTAVFAGMFTQFAHFIKLLSAGPAAIGKGITAISGAGKYLTDTAKIMQGFGRISVFGKFTADAGKAASATARLGAGLGRIASIARIATGPWGLVATAVIFLLDKLGLLDDALRAIISPFKGVWEEVKPAFDDLKSAVDELGISFSSRTGFGKALRDVWSFIRGRIVPVLELFFGIISEQGRAAGRIIGNVIATPLRVAAGLIRVVARLLRGDLPGALDALKGIGSDIIRGIFKPFEIIGEMFVNVFRRAWRAVKKFLGISSPSTLFKEVGQAILDGLLAPFDLMWDLFKGVGKKIIDAIIAGIKAAPDVLKAITDKLPGPVKKVVEYSPAGLVVKGADALFGGDDDDDKKKGKPKKPRTLEVPVQAAPAGVANFEIRVNVDTLKKASEAFRDAYNAMSRRARVGAREIGGYVRDLRVGAERSMYHLSDYWHDRWRKMSEFTHERLRRMTSFMGTTMTSLKRVVYDGMSYVGGTTNRALRAFDADPVNLRLERPGGERRATGGPIGQWGERGKDAVLTWLGRGEVVLNHWQQRAVNAMMRGQNTLQSVASRVTGYHAGHAGEAIGYAKGRIVGIPWAPGEEVNSSILALLTRLRRLFRFNVTDAFDRDRSAGHKSPGHNVTGTAVDAVPGPGGSWGLIERLGRWAVSKGLVVGYGRGVPGSQAWPGHGRNHHIHIEFGGGSKLAGAIDMPEVRAPRVRGASAVLRTIAQAAINSATRGARAHLNDQFPEAAGGVSHLDVRGASPSTIFSYFRRRGFSPAQSAAWVGNLYQESKLSPSAVNPTSGATGIAQWLGGRLTALKKNRGWRTLETQLNFIWQELMGSESGAYRAIKAARTVEDAVQAIAFRYERMGAHEVGNRLGPARDALRRFGGGEYARGGEIPGPLGRAVPILAHAGEWVLNKGQQLKLAVMTGLHPDRIKSLIGLPHGQRSAATGTSVAAEASEPENTSVDALFTTAAHRQRLDRIRRGLYQLSSRAIQSLEGVTTEVRRLFNALEVINSQTKKRLSGNLSALTQENGLLDQMDAQREIVANRTARGIAFAVTKIKRIGDKAGKWIAVRGIDPAEQATRELDAARDNLDNIIGERSFITKALGKVNRRIKQLQRGGISTSESAEFRELQGIQVNLRERYRSIRDDEAQAAEALMQAQIAQQQAVVDDINKRYERAGSFVSLMERAANATGNTDLQDRVRQEQRRQMEGQANELEKRIAAARAAGADDLADQLVTQVGDLRAQIFEGLQQDVQTNIDRVNEEFQRKSTRLDIRGRIADVRARFGAAGIGGMDPVGAAREREAINAQRGTDLNEQRDRLRQIYNAQLALPQEQRNITAMKALEDQLADLDASVVENTATQRELAAATRQASLEAITARQNFQGGVQGSLSQLVEAIGGLAGNTVDTQRLIQLTNDAVTTLQGTGGSLRGDLLTGYGIDLRGVSGMNLVDAIRGLNFDQITSQMSEPDKQVFETLINEIINNELALIQNTDKLEDLSGVMEPQTFTTTAWQWFRQAIFNGQGDVLPQYAVPSSISSPAIVSVGSANAAAGVQPLAYNSDGSPATRTIHQDIDINYNEVNESPSPEETANRVGWYARGATTAD